MAFDPHEHGKVKDTFDPQAMGAMAQPEMGGAPQQMSYEQQGLNPFDPASPEMQKQMQGAPWWKKAILGSTPNEDFGPTGQYFPQQAAQHPISKAVLGTMAQMMIPGGGSMLYAPLRAAANIGIGTLASMPENSKNPGEDLKDNAMVNTAIEGLPFAARGAKRLAEWFHPLEYAGKQVEAIKNYFNETREAQKKAYSHIDPYKQDVLKVNPRRLFDKNDEMFFTPNVNKLKKIFIKDPTLENAHNLQSQMYSSASGISAKDAASVSAREALTNTRQKIQNIISGHLTNVDPAAAAQYQEGRRITRDLLSPTQSTDLLKKITKGRAENVQPHELQAAYKEAKEEGSLPRDHYLNKLSQNLDARVNNGKALQYALPAAASAITGELAGGHMGALGGLATGGAIGHFLAPSATKFIQNPQVQKLMRNVVAPGYYNAARGMFNSNE